MYGFETTDVRFRVIENLFLLIFRERFLSVLAGGLHYLKRTDTATWRKVGGRSAEVGGNLAEGWREVGVRFDSVFGNLAGGRREVSSV